MKKLPQGWYQGWKYLSNGDVTFWFGGVHYRASLVGRTKTRFTPEMNFIGERAAFMTPEGHIIYQDNRSSGRRQEED